LTKNLTYSLRPARRRVPEPGSERRIGGKREKAYSTEENGSKLNNRATYEEEWYRKKTEEQNQKEKDREPRSKVHSLQLPWLERRETGPLTKKGDRGKREDLASKSSR